MRRIVTSSECDSFDGVTKIAQELFNDQAIIHARIDRIEEKLNKKKVDKKKPEGFAMIKTKFGDNVRCKTEQSQDNEILCKVLAHNIVCLIHEIFELKIDVDFSEVAKKLPAQKVV